MVSVGGGDLDLDPDELSLQHAPIVMDRIGERRTPINPLRNTFGSKDAFLSVRAIESYAVSRWLIFVFHLSGGYRVFVCSAAGPS